MNILSIIPGQLRRVGRKNGGEYAGACPWCGDGGKGAGSDRFHVWPEQGQAGTFWCRVCGKGGDAIKYLIDYEGISYKDACARLNLDPAATMPKTGKTPTGWQPKEATSPADVWADHARKFVDWCHDRLLERPIELAWLAERGIGVDMVKKYSLGYNPAHAWREGAAWGVTMPLKENGTAKKLWLPRGLVIPMIEADGRVHRLRVRQPDQSPRYMVIPGSGREPLCSRAAEAVFILESELDAILLDGLVGDVAGFVAMGNDSAKPTAALYPMLQDALFLGISLDSDLPTYNPVTDRIDMPGPKCSRWWLEHFPRAMRVPMIGGKDPGDAFRAGVDLRTWVLAALPPYFHIKADLDNERIVRRQEEALRKKTEERLADEMAASAVAVAEREIIHHFSAPRAVASGDAVETPSPFAAENQSPVADQPAEDHAAHHVVTLTNGRSFYLTADRQEWERLTEAGEVVFSQHELARLQSACATMDQEERLAAAMLVLDLKEVFPSSWIRRGEAIQG